VPAATESTTPPQSEAASSAIPEVPTEPERLITVETSHWIARFSTRGAVPVSWQLLLGPENKPILASDSSPLELIPQTGIERTGLPLRLSIGNDTERLNARPYRAESAGGPVGDHISIADGEAAEIAFTTSDPETNTEITKRFAFTGGLYDF